MKRALLLALGATAIAAVPIFLVFGGLTSWPATAPPIEPGVTEWDPEMRPAGFAGVFTGPYLTTEGWLALAVVFAVAFAVALVVVRESLNHNAG